jgi:flagellar biosynthesis protein FlhG
LRDELFTLAGTYDRAVIDIGAGVDRTARVMAGRAGMYLVLTMDEPTSLTDAYAFIKVMTMENPGTDIRIVVNMVASKQQGERTYATLLKACEGFLNISPPLAGIIRRDPRVPESIRHQTPLLTRHPNCDAAGDVVAIAGKLLETP